MSHRRAHTKISVDIEVIGEVKTSTLKATYDRSDNVRVRRIVPEPSRWADPQTALWRDDSATLADSTQATPGDGPM